ncbi:MAG: ribonuclease P protein component [Lachnospiraceae bacterium]|nr:ribonuclease P protein component [Lachnospiraceae bacterium]
MKIISLRKGKEFSDVYKSGSSKANRYLVMYVRSNGLDYNRIGISVSKKVGNSVVRHRIRRLIKESLRLNGDRFNIGLDLVVIARGTAKGRTYQEIADAVSHLAQLHNIVL